MANVRCPMCGKFNPEELEECQYCGARLKPVAPSTLADSQPLRLGEEPVKSDTSEFDKSKPSGDAPIRPGEAPTKKNTGELERALPAWLRSLREGKRPAEGESLAEPSSEEDLPADSQTDSSGGLPDWLAGLGKADSDEEEVPDWLAGLRGDKTSESTPAPGMEGEPVPEPGNEDWINRLGSEPPKPKSDPIDTAKLPALDLPAYKPSPEPAPEGDFSEWLQNLQSAVPTEQESPAASQGGENMPDWLSGLAGTSVQSGPALSGSEEPAPAESGPVKGGSEEPAPAESIPDWLSGLTGISAQSGSALMGSEEPGPAESGPVKGGFEEPAPAESKPDWLDRLNQKPTGAAMDAPAQGGELVPDWLSSFGSEPAAPATSPGENVPDWLSNLETKSGAEAGTPATVFGSEASAPGNPPSETPDWLSQLQAEANAADQLEKQKDDQAVVSETPASPGGSEPLPAWLAGIGYTTPSYNDSPALVLDNKDASPGGQGETAFSMESPDWLSKLNPDQNTEKTAENKDSQPDSKNIEAAELPSWVQAMRPVESVVDSKMTPLDESQATEQSGPLAGLRGVLPAGPGLGSLRKPPAYSTKLQVSEGQQRYAASLEKLVAGESLPRAVKTTHLPSNRLWRWFIAVLLILAAGLPFASNLQFTPPTLLLSSDKGASANIIDGLSSNVPVLVAFDYDPALSGELEVVAAPVMDQLLAKGIPLALISTSPTGPALAEHFLQTTPLVNMYKYQSGVQYVNLGYLAGGPAGILYLADSIKDAMPVSLDGKSAWDTGLLQGIQGLDSFAAVIILTDNADTGRNWIEQAGPRLGNTPMLMIISAQAEPMIQPYFDSGQLKGLVSGLSDAKIYEQPHNRTGLAYHYWNSFSVGMLVAELLIAAAAILGVMLDQRANHKNSRGAA